MISDERATVTRRYTVTAEDLVKGLGLKGRPWKIEQAVGRDRQAKWVITTAEEIPVDD